MYTVYVLTRVKVYDEHILIKNMRTRFMVEQDATREQAREAIPDGDIIKALQVAYSASNLDDDSVGAPIGCKVTSITLKTRGVKQRKENASPKT